MPISKPLQNNASRDNFESSAPDSAVSWTSGIPSKPSTSDGHDYQDYTSSDFTVKKAVSWGSNSSDGLPLANGTGGNVKQLQSPATLKDATISASSLSANTTVPNGSFTKPSSLVIPAAAMPRASGMLYESSMERMLTPSRGSSSE